MRVLIYGPPAVHKLCAFWTSFLPKPKMHFFLNFLIYAHFGLLKVQTNTHLLEKGMVVNLASLLSRLPNAPFISNRNLR